jgi:hypothetical protein
MVTTPSAVTRPAAPSGLVATINANRQVQLSWRDNSTNETVFVVQRSTNGYSWTTLGQVPANSTGTIDTTAARGRSYYYRVYAYNGAGYSTSSNRVRVTTPALAARITSTTSIKLPTITPFTGKPTATTTATAARGTTSSSTSAGQAWAVSSLTGSANSAADGTTATEWQSAVDALFSSLRSSRSGSRR